MKYIQITNELELKKKLIIHLKDISLHVNCEMVMLFSDNSFVVFKVNEDKISKPDFYLAYELMSDRQILYLLYNHKLIDSEEYDIEIKNIIIKEKTNKVELEKQLDLKTLNELARKYNYILTSNN